jgi:hypothetical protein
VSGPNAAAQEKGCHQDGAAELTDPDPGELGADRLGERAGTDRSLTLGREGGMDGGLDQTARGAGRSLADQHFRKEGQGRGGAGLGKFAPKLVEGPGHSFSRGVLRDAEMLADLGKTLILEEA